MPFRASLLDDSGRRSLQCLRLVVESPDLVASIARRGPAYVLENYTWSRVLDRVEDSLTSSIGASTSVEAPLRIAVGR
jgi:hypothetical protein